MIRQFVFFEVGLIKPSMQTELVCADQLCFTPQFVMFLNFVRVSRISDGLVRQQLRRCCFTCVWGWVG